MNSPTLIIAFAVTAIILSLVVLFDKNTEPLPPCTQLPTTSTPVRDRPNGKQMLFTVFACPDGDGITLRGAYVILEDK